MKLLKDNNSMILKINKKIQIIMLKILKNSLIKIIFLMKMMMKMMKNFNK